MVSLDYQLDTRLSHREGILHGDCLDQVGMSVVNCLLSSLTQEDTFQEDSMVAEVGPRVFEQ